MMKLRFFLALALAVSGLTVSAQNARSILDATAKRIQQSGCIRARFKATSFNGTTPQGQTSGTMLMKGSQFQMTTPDISTWFDGHTQWSMMPSSGEVNITEPTSEEVAAMNPSAFLNIYKKGYRATARTSSLRGQPTYEVHLVAKSAKTTITDIYVDVTQKDHTLLCIRAKQHGDWSRISILSFEPHQKVTDEVFRFPAKDYPNVEVIDLR